MTLSLNSTIATTLAVALLGGFASAQTRVQILHASDLEGGVEAISDAPNFAAVVEALEADAALAGVPSLLLSSGDNYIPGPFFSAAGDFSLRSVLRTVLAQPQAREAEGRIDVSIMNILGFDASAIGNHEFDAGPAAIQAIIGTDIRNVGQPNQDVRWLGAQFPYLSSNLDFSAEASLSGLFTSSILPSTNFQGTLADVAAAAAAPKIAPATIVQRGGQTFGVVGATTPLVESISSTGDVAVRNPGAGTNDMAALASILQPTIDALVLAGVDKIILVTHLQQLALEQQLIQLLSGVDIVLAGGSDTLLADGTDRLRAGDTVGGPYPVVTTNLDGEPALIVSTDGQYSYVGRLVVDFDVNGVVVPGSVVATESGAYATDDQGVIDVAGSLAAAFAPGTDAEKVQTLTGAVSAIVIARDANIVGRADVFLEGRRTEVRTQETNLGTLTAEANLFVARQADPTTLVSHKNGGGIRNQIGSIDGFTGELGPNVANPLSGKQAGEISQLDIENSLRFNNALTLLTLSRAQLKQVLEHAVAASGPGATPGQFGQFAGVSFSFDVALPAGSRVVSASLTEPGVAEPIFVIDGNVVGTDPVRLVTLNFLADGGDSYPFPTFTAADPVFANRVDLQGNPALPAGAATFATVGTEQDAFAEYMLANFSMTPYAEPELPVTDDARLMQIGQRAGLDVTKSAGNTMIDFTISGAAPNSIVALALALQANPTTLDLGVFGMPFLALPAELLLPIGLSDATGSAAFVLPNPMLPMDVSVAGQAFSLELTGNGIAIGSTELATFSVGS
jgi:2',3'-cyclic-nucleotide 2'-phosphodiesterase (5'-nucleotidase family)